MIVNQDNTRLNSQGFSLIEIIVVLFIIGLIGRMSVQLLSKRSAVSLSAQFSTALKGLLTHAYQASITTRTPQKIVIDLKKNIITSQSTLVQQDLVQRFPSFFKNQGQVALSGTMSIEELFIEGKEVLHKAGKEVTSAWFYISNQGVCQPVIINALFDQGSEPYHVSFVISPFGARIQEYATYQKPS